MSTLIETGGKHYVFIKGASEYMIDISEEFLDLETGKVIDMNYELQNTLNQAINNMATQALRTIGLAYKEVDIDEIDTEAKDERGVFEFEKDGFILIGICGIKDIIRKEVPDSIRICNGAGIEVKMVTGDNKITARAIAKEIGIITPENEANTLVMEGPEFLR